MSRSSVVTALKEAESLALIEEGIGAPERGGPISQAEMERRFEARIADRAGSVTSK